MNYSTIKCNPNTDTNIPKQCRELSSYLDEHNLQQLNHHTSRKGEKNILDLIITNLPDEHSDVTCGRYNL